MSATSEGEFWINELRDLSAETRYMIWRALPNQLGPKSFEKLDAIWDDDNETAFFHCPHCETPLEYTEITIVDWMKRESDFSDYDFDEQTLEASYGDADELSTIAYECGECGMPVSLPAGWKEV